MTDTPNYVPPEQRAMRQQRDLEKIQFTRAAEAFKADIFANLEEHIRNFQVPVDRTTSRLSKSISKLNPLGKQTYWSTYHNGIYSLRVRIQDDETYILGAMSKGGNILYLDPRRLPMALEYVVQAIDGGIRRYQPESPLGMVKVDALPNKFTCRLSKTLK